MIESGTTTYADMYYFEEEIAQATRAAGLRGVLGQTIIQFPVADAKTPAEGLARAEAFIKSFNGDRLIVPAVAPHAMYTLDRDTLVAAAELGRRYSVPVIIHLAETEDELKQSRAQHQLSPTAYLESLGFWSPRTVAAHGVWVDDDDIAILARAKRRRLAQSREQHEAGERRRAGDRSTKPPASPLDWAPTARPATTTSTCSKPCARRRFWPSCRPGIRRPFLRAKRWRWRPSVARGRSDWTGSIGSLEAGKRADLITVVIDSARETPLYDPDLASGLRHARRRRQDDHRERPHPDAQSSARDARSRSRCWPMPAPWRPSGCVEAGRTASRRRRRCAASCDTARRSRDRSRRRTCPRW